MEQIKIKGYYLHKDQRTSEIINEGVCIKGTPEEIAYKIIQGEKARGSRFYKVKDPFQKYDN